MLFDCKRWIDLIDHCNDGEHRFRNRNRRMYRNLIELLCLESANYGEMEWAEKLKQMGLFDALRTKNFWTNLAFIGLYGKIIKWRYVFGDKFVNFENMALKIAGDRTYLFKREYIEDFKRVRHIDGQPDEIYYEYPND